MAGAVRMDPCATHILAALLGPDSPVDDQWNLDMEWLNYHHLFYFWTTVKAGTITAAAEELHLTRPTVASQIRELETAFGQPVFQKQGRGLVMTDFGKKVFEYADEIFSVGQELREFVKTGRTNTRKSFRVGVTDVVPKLIAFELLKPALEQEEPPRFICHEGKMGHLLSELAHHRLDMLISDSPAPSTLEFRVYSHLLGECGLTMMGSAKLAKSYRKGFPESLTGAPLLLPTEQTAVRRALDYWLEERNLFPHLVAEFEDSALLKTFGQAGIGIFPVPTALEESIQQQFDVQPVGRIPEVLDRFYVISPEKRLKDESTIRVVQQAKSFLFDV